MAWAPVPCVCVGRRRSAIIASALLLFPGLSNKRQGPHEQAIVRRRPAVTSCSVEVVDSVREDAVLFGLSRGSGEVE